MTDSLPTDDHRLHSRRLAWRCSKLDQYVHRNHGKLIDWYQDVGSASPTQSRLPKQQPQLVRAISRARAADALLLVARLARRARSTAGLTLRLVAGPPLVYFEPPKRAP